MRGVTRMLRSRERDVMYGHIHTSEHVGAFTGRADCGCLDQVG
jgi:hypothetical protein